MKLVKRGALVLMLCMGSSVAAAQEVVLTWVLPSKDCSGKAIPDGELVELEFYLKRGWVPGSGTHACSGEVVPLPSGLPSARKVPATAANYKTTLAPGDYQVRVRVKGKTLGWSVLSNRLQFTVKQDARPNKVVIKLGG